MSDENKNLELWNKHFTPHKDALKPFRRKGGFSGTAIDPMWLIREATSEWGPIGGQWGYLIDDERYVAGAPIMVNGAVVCTEIIHVLRLHLWYPGGNVYHYGQTQFVGVNKDGPFTDEEAPKKSLTDALSKALSMLGFGAAVHMGMFDGNKYVDLARGDTGQSATPPKDCPNGKEQPEAENSEALSPTDAITELLGELKALVGGAEAKRRWVNLLAHSENSCGALDLATLSNRASIDQLRGVYKELKQCIVAANRIENKEDENEVRKDSVPAPEQE